MLLCFDEVALLASIVFQQVCSSRCPVRNYQRVIADQRPGESLRLYLACNASSIFNVVYGH